LLVGCLASLVGPGMLLSAADHPPAVGEADTRLAEDILRATRAGDLPGAVQIVKKNLPAGPADDVEVPDSADLPSQRHLLASLLKLAEQVRAAGDREGTAEVYHRAAWLVQSSGAPNDLVPDSRRAAVWLAAARHLTVAGRPGEALQWLRQVSTIANVGADGFAKDGALATRRLPDGAAEPIPGQLIGVAAGLLEQRSLAEAAEAYALAESWAESLAWEFRDPVPPALATARLGRAWSMTMEGTDDEAALISVERFLKLHAEHPDAASAMLLRMTCLSRLGRTAQWEAARDALFERYPQSDAALQMAVVACETWTWSIPKGSPPPDRWMVRVLEDAEAVARSTRVRSRDRLLAGALLLSLIHDADHAQRVYEQALWHGDLRSVAVGKVVTDMLHFLDQNGRGVEAERLAERWIGRLADSAANARGDFSVSGNGSMIAEAAGRWAGRTERWGLLAELARRPQPEQFVGRLVLGSDEERPSATAPDAEWAEPEPSDGKDPHALHVARLFAESLLQTGRPDSSLRWWQAVVDGAGADDFPTLLRLAETSVAVDDVTTASTRLAKARAAADATTQQRVLVDLLAADVQVRQLQFDRGRSLLEGVVRSAAADAGVRGRAQWMIGETYFMQRRFAEAIDAYRLVEGISGDRHWTAAALVQAGKSFEQLGRTREAAVCYATLVQRFGDSQHASGARDRLALLRPEATAPTGTIRR